MIIRNELIPAVEATEFYYVDLAVSGLLYWGEIAKSCIVVTEKNRPNLLQKVQDALPAGVSLIPGMKAKRFLTENGITDAGGWHNFARELRGEIDKLKSDGTKPKVVYLDLESCVKPYVHADITVPDINRFCKDLRYAVTEFGNEFPNTSFIVHPGVYGETTAAQARSLLIVQFVDDAIPATFTDFHLSGPSFASNTMDQKADKLARERGIRQIDILYCDTRHYSWSPHQIVENLLSGGPSIPRLAYSRSVIIYPGIENFIEASKRLVFEIKLKDERFSTVSKRSEPL
jgi:hypothetical protein